MKGAQCAILGDLNEVLSFSFHTDVSLNCSRSMVNYLAEQGTLSRPQGAADNHTGFSKALNTDWDCWNQDATEFIPNGHKLQEYLQE